MQTKSPEALLNENIFPIEDDGNRIVYKLVRVEEDGTVLPATEYEITQVDSLVEDDSAPKHWNKHGGTAEVEDGNKITNEDWYYGPREEEITSVATELEVERRKLHLKLEFLDLMLEEIDSEHRRRLTLETSSKEQIKHISSNSWELKRRRRPNPKYFSSAAATRKRDGFQHGHVSQSGDFEAVLGQIEKEKCQMSVLTEGNKKVLNVVEKEYDKSAESFILQEKKIISMSHNVDSSTVSGNQKALEALSIRELHKAFFRTFGKETSVKDKHWLKRQICRGSRQFNRNCLVLDDDMEGMSKKFPKMERFDDDSINEQPLASYCGISRNGEATQEPFEDANETKAWDRFLNRNLDEKHARQESLTGAESLLTCTRHKEISITKNVLQEPCGNVESTGIGFGDVTNSKQTCGKRVRKPNRKYIEDFDDDFDFSSIGTRHALSTIATTQESQSMKSGSRIISTCPGGKLNGYPTHGFAESSDATDATMPELHVKRRRKCFNSSVHDPDIFQVETAGIRDFFDDLSSDRLSVEEDSLDEYEGKTARVPTSNGGTRRKHHRPWTLNEVLTLVEGVAQCGGGKWADIKKSAFSAVGYRTAVDLKDKWRNLLRASRAQAQTNKQPENRKKNISAVIPAPILARVRELAALQNRSPTSSIGGCPIQRSGRVLQSERLMYRI